MIRSRWFCSMNSRGRPCRPAGSRGEAPAGAESVALPFCAAPLATQRRYSLAQRLDQQLVLGGARAEVGHHRHVDELGQEVLTALKAAVFDLAEDRAVDRPGDYFSGAAGDGIGLLQLLAATVEDVGKALQGLVAAALSPVAGAVHLDDEEAGTGGVLAQEAHRRPAGGPDSIVPGRGAGVGAENPLAELGRELIVHAEEAILLAGEAAVEVRAPRAGLLADHLDAGLRVAAGADQV